MFTANKYALQNIYKQSFNSIMFFLCIMLTSASVFGTGFFTENMELGIEQAGQQIGAEIIVVPYGYKEEAEGVLFQGDACTMLMEKDISREITGIAGIQAVSPQLFMKTLSLPCCAAAGVQLIAIDYETDFVVRPWLKESGMEQLGLDEMIAGSACGLQEQDKVEFYGKTFTVTGVLKESGMGYDESVFISRETADQITASEDYGDTFGGQTGLVSVILVDLEDGYDTAFVRDKIDEILEESNVETLTTGNFVTQLLERMATFRTFSYIINLFLLLLSAVALFGLVTITFYSRRNRIGSLLSVGIQKTVIIKSFFLEYFYLTAGGVLAGICFICIIVFPLYQAIKNALSLPYQFVGFISMAKIAGTTLLINGFILLVAVSFSFFKIIKTEPAILAEEQS